MKSIMKRIHSTYRYMKDAISSKTKILNLRKIEKDTLSNQIWNNIQSNPIDLNNTASWIKSKFEIVMIQGNINATKGEEYKLKNELV